MLYGAVNLLRLLYSYAIFWYQDVIITVQLCYSLVPRCKHYFIVMLYFGFRM